MDHESSFDQNAASIRSKYAALENDLHFTRKKLDGKNDAILILSQELGQCQRERDQYRLIADQLRNRCMSLKRQLGECDVENGACNSSVSLLSDLSISNQLEVDDLRQRLADAEGDIKLLRQKIAQQRLSVTKSFVAQTPSQYEKEVLIKELELCKQKYIQVELDMKQVLAEKEELVTERDTYKTKYSRLNQELNLIMKGEGPVLDIDSLSMENKFLKQQVNTLQEEADLAKAALHRYKSSAVKKKSSVSILKTSTSILAGGLVVSQQQIKRLLSFTPSVGDAGSLQLIQELKNLTSALLETVNDKNLALSHQRKANKILASRILDLEESINENHGDSKFDTSQLEALKDLCMSEPSTPTASQPSSSDPSSPSSQSELLIFHSTNLSSKSPSSPTEEVLSVVSLQDTEPQSRSSPMLSPKRVAFGENIVYDDHE